MTVIRPRDREEAQRRAFEGFGGHAWLDPDPDSWKNQALCAQTDPELFFPEKGGSTREAKQVCSRCEVRTECLEEALATNERYGIWGGLCERERHALMIERWGRPRRGSSGGKSRWVYGPAGEGIA